MEILSLPPVLAIQLIAILSLLLGGVSAVLVYIFVLLKKNDGEIIVRESCHAILNFEIAFCITIFLFAVGVFCWLFHRRVK